jgi:hypothetical protein
VPFKPQNMHDALFRLKCKSYMGITAFKSGEGSDVKSDPNICQATWGYSADFVYTVLFIQSHTCGCIKPIMPCLPQKRGPLDFSSVGLAFLPTVISEE